MIEMKESRITTYVLHQDAAHCFLNVDETLPFDSSVIECMLMGIPMRRIFLKEDGDGFRTILEPSFVVNSFISFLNGNFPLANMKVLKELEGKTIDDLDHSLFNKLHDFVFDVVILNDHLDEDSLEFILEQSRNDII